MTCAARVVADAWRFWVELFDQRESGTSWALFRIGIGGCLLYSLLSIAAAGLLDVLWVDEAFGGYRSVAPVRLLLVEIGPATPALVHTFYAVALLSSAALTLGVGGRFATFLALQAYLALTNINHDTVGGYDLMLTDALWLLFLCDASATLSLRSRLVTGRWASDVQVMAWPRYLGIFQLLVVYTWTGLQKVSADWFPAGDYSALYYVFQDPTWRRFDMRWVASVYPLTQVATAVTWLFESGAWLMFVVYYCRYTRERHGRIRGAFNRWDLRKPFTLVGIALHVGIFATLNVGPFSFVALSYYFCLWRPEQVPNGDGR